jgi:hypothetical protein
MEVDLCAQCRNNAQDEDGEFYCAQSLALDEDEMERYMTRRTVGCPFYESGDEYTTVRKQN